MNATTDPFTIQGPQTIAVVERELLAIHQGMPSSMQLPQKLRKWYLGGEAAMIQLLITWCQACANARIVTHITSNDTAPVQLEALAKRPFGFVALMMAKDVLLFDRETTIRSLAYAACRDRVLQMNRGPASETLGKKVALICVDHSTKAALSPFYYHSDTVRDRVDFVALSRAIAERTTRGTPDVPIPSTMHNAMGAILHELIRNTHDWARTGIDNAPLRRSVRGLLAQRHSWEWGEVTRLAEGSPPLEGYVTNVHDHVHAPRFRFLELSVFDSGVGLASHWLKRKYDESLSIHEEFDACNSCLQKYGSTTNSPFRGLGLHEVMSTLSALAAFMRVRTGRLSLYRDFLRNPYDGTNASGNAELFDWVSDGTRLTECAPVSGTLYTILIPVRA